MRALQECDLSRLHEAELGSHLRKAIEKVCRDCRDRITIEIEEEKAFLEKEKVLLS